MTRTAKRMLMMLATMATLIVAMAVWKYADIQRGIAQASSFQPPPEAVTTVVAVRELWRESVDSIGTVEAVHGVTVSADLPGIVQQIPFTSGAWVEAGEILAVLDTQQEQAQLAAAEARLELARLNLDRIRGLRQEGITSQADYDTAVAAHAEASAAAGEIRAMIQRKTIRAPFSGILGIRQVHLGQYLDSGDPLVPLQSLDPIHVNFSVPQQELMRLRAGGEVRVSAEGIGGEAFPGRITAIDSVVDESTRNVRVQATLRNRGRRLRPGMFVSTRVLLEVDEPVIALPATAISHAPYGDSVFIVEEQKGPDGRPHRAVRQQFVKLGGSRGDQVAVLSGIVAGAEVVTSGVFKLRNGAAVQVNNQIQPPNDPAPHPDDR